MHYDIVMNWLQQVKQISFHFMVSVIINNAENEPTAPPLSCLRAKMSKNCKTPKSKLTSPLLWAKNLVFWCFPGNFLTLNNFQKNDLTSLAPYPGGKKRLRRRRGVGSFSTEPWNFWAQRPHLGSGAGINVAPAQGSWGPQLGPFKKSWVICFVGNLKFFTITWK